MDKPTQSRWARLHPKTYLSVHGILGFALATGCAWLFFAIADAVPEKGLLVRVDGLVSVWIEAHGTEWGESIFAVVSLLGAQVLGGLLIIAAVVFVVRRDWRHLFMLAVTAGGGALLNVALKTTFHRTRPTFASEFPVSSWSFPSGHAMDSLIGYGILAYWLGARFPRARRLIVAGAVALILAIGFSRIYLGVHFLSDVVAGYTAGLLWLTVCISGYEFANRRQVGPSGPDEA